MASASGLDSSEPTATNHDASMIADASGLATIEALPGQSIAIPCNISKWFSSLANQQQTNQLAVTIILWYKNNELSNTINSPIYTLDARQVPSLSKARHQIGSGGGGAGTDTFDSIDTQGQSMEPSSDENRLYFDVNQQVPSLIIRSVEAADQGLYRCRVDFKKAPTQIYKVKLQLISKYLYCLYGIRIDNFATNYPSVDIHVQIAYSWISHSEIQFRRLSTFPELIIAWNNRSLNLF